MSRPRMLKGFAQAGQHFLPRDLMWFRTQGPAWRESSGQAGRGFPHPRLHWPRCHPGRKVLSYKSYRSEPFCSEPVSGRQVVWIQAAGSTWLMAACESQTWWFERHRARVQTCLKS